MGEKSITGVTCYCVLMLASLTPGKILLTVPGDLKYDKEEMEAGRSERVPGSPKYSLVLL